MDLFAIDMQKFTEIGLSSTADSLYFFLFFDRNWFFDFSYYVVDEKVDLSLFNVFNLGGENLSIW